MATILASVFATGTLAFAADDPDPEDNQIDHDVVQDVEAIKQMAAQLRAKGMVVDIEHVSRAVTGRVHDKPIGTGPNGEKH